MTDARVGRVAYALGFAGLLPQVGAVALIATGVPDGCHDQSANGCTFGYVLAMTYGLLILSFLGGIWWGFAMRREHKQGPLAAVAVLPSLIGTGIAFSWAGAETSVPLTRPLLPILLGTAIIATLLVDRHLVASGEAPTGWMRLRVPLSVGLGTLTIAAGLLLAI